MRAGKGKRESRVRGDRRKGARRRRKACTGERHKKLLFKASGEERKTGERTPKPCSSCPWTRRTSRSSFLRASRPTPCPSSPPPVLERPERDPVRSLGIRRRPQRLSHLDLRSLQACRPSLRRSQSTTPTHRAWEPPLRRGLARESGHWEV